jgi:phage tail-like protein
MKLSAFTVEPDLRGRRVRACWHFDFSAGEGPSALPSIRLARKTLDYEFPVPASSGDHFVIYDSAFFPTAGAALASIASSDQPKGTGRIKTETESSSVDGIEVIRRTITLTSAGDGSISSMDLEILDAGSLQPLTTYYYELRIGDGSGLVVSGPLRGAATTTDRYGLGARLYSQLPEMYRRNDVVVAAPPTPWAVLSESDTKNGQLARFLDVMGSTADYLRSRAEGMLDIHDVNTVDAKVLPLMAAWIGWKLGFNASIPEQRHEIRYGPALYRMTGTIPGCMIWVRRLTQWNGRIKEFGRNVFFSNDLGNPSDPTDKGSRTVDTEDAALLAKIKTFDDDVDYTYDTGTSLDSWYSYNTIGIFLKPAESATPNEIDRRAGRLQANVSIFLPVNVRGVVILDVPKGEASLSESVGLLDTEDN